MTNIELRQAIKANRLYHYEIAEELGISEYTLCVWLRHELDPEHRRRVEDAINALTSGGSHNGR